MSATKTMKNPQKMSMDEIRLAIELLEDELLAGRPTNVERLVSLSAERMRRIKVGLASLR